MTRRISLAVALTRVWSVSAAEMIYPLKEGRACEVLGCVTLDGEDLFYCLGDAFMMMIIPSSLGSRILSCKSLIRVIISGNRQKGVVGRI